MFQKLTRLLPLTIYSLAFGVACNDADPSADIREAEQRLSPEDAATLGFESAALWSDWSSGPGVTLSSSPNASQGSASLAVSGIGYAGLRNVNGISKDGPGPGVVGYDVWIPTQQVNPWWHGNTSLRIDCPSAGIRNRLLGSASFNGLPKGQFVRVEYQVPEQIRRALDRTNYHDLRFVLAINVEPGSATHYVDRFTLGPGDTTCTPSDDGNSCTVDACDPATGQQTHVPVPGGTSCGDGNLCNGAETCDAVGVCKSGTSPVVDDGNTCTADACHPTTGVSHTPVTAGTSCADSDACNGIEFCDAGGECQAGIVPVVDDENPCTADSCDSATGVAHLPVDVGTSCADGNACNGAEVCDGAGTCQAGVVPQVDDGNACTADACDPAGGVSHTPLAAGATCDNGNVCDGTSACDGSGACVAGVPPTVDDGNVCTVDACDAASGVSHEPVAVGTSCGDGDLCNGDEVCSGAGSCEAGTPLAADDGNPCTADSCDPVAGVVHVSVSAGTSCGDDDLCNGAETCDGAGTCQTGTPVETDDGNVCTVGSCDSATGEVTQDALPLNSPCGDGDLCNGSEFCDGAGSCASGEPLDPDDGNVCTVDSCDPIFGLENAPEPSGTSCEDADVCNGTEACDGAGTCGAGTPLNPDDGNACTEDFCDPLEGVVHEPSAVGTSCADGNVCNGDELCSGSGACEAGTQLDPDDGDVCTQDACDPETGVVHEPAPAGTSCDDGDFCTGVDVCDGSGSCLSPGPADLDDGNPCTADACDPVDGVTHELVTEGTPCSDGNACNGLEVCDQNGSCNPGGEPLVDDGNPCTADSCDPASGVANEPLDVGAACDLGACMGTGECNPDALCERTVPALTADEDPCTLEFCDEETGALRVVECSENNLAALTTAGSTMKFLYEGPNAVQIGVSAGAINPETSGVLRGRVIWEDGLGVPNVKVEVVGNPEYGHTRTQVDGQFVVVTPSGGEVTVRLTKAGYPVIYRNAEVGLRDQASLDEVVLVQRDHQSTSIRMGLGAGQVAAASEVQDSDGARRARVYFPPGTRATLRLVDGTGLSVPSLGIRATEYTVGERGPERMPAALPPTTAYTYALEITADEAVAARAEDIEFDRYVFLYNDNFLGFDTGTPMPLGYVDQATGKWIAEPSGTTITVLSETQGSATISGHEDLDPSLRPTADELALIAEQFEPGDSFWRSALHHFTDYDVNQGSTPPPGAGPPPGSISSGGPGMDDGGDNECTGSRIDPNARTVIQDLDLVGTSEQLHHSSIRAVGVRTLQVPVTGSTTTDILRVQVEVQVAGRRFDYTFEDPDPNQNFTFVWDGQDGMGREVQGMVPVRVKRSNIYQAYYGVPNLFGYNGNGLQITNVPGREELSIDSVWEGNLGVVGGPALGVAGLSLSSHHLLDRGEGRVYLGDGATFAPGGTGSVAERVLGGGTITTPPVVGTNGTNYRITSFAGAINGHAPRAFDVGPDERIYANAQIGTLWYLLVMDGLGTIERVVSLPFSPASPAVSRDGRVFVAIRTGGTIFEVKPDGTRERLLDTDYIVRDMEVSADGAGLYILWHNINGAAEISYLLLGDESCEQSPDVATCWAERNRPFVGRVTATGTTRTCPQPGWVTGQAQFQDIEVGPSGVVYVTQTPGGLGGASGVSLCRYSLDGVATEAYRTNANAKNGHALFALGGEYSFLGGNPPHAGGNTASALPGIFRLNETFASKFFAVKGDLARVEPSQPTTPGQLDINLMHDIESTPDGQVVYVMDAEGVGRALWRIGSKLPRYGGALGVPSEDGAENYFFFPDGRHRETRNSRSGALIWKFEYADDLTLQRAVKYDATGAEAHSIELERSSGEVTRVLVDPDGAGSSGARVHDVVTGAEGYMAQLTNPANESYVLGYESPFHDGLVTAFTEKSGRTKAYDYDETGGLTAQTDAPLSGGVAGGTFTYDWSPAEGTSLPSTMRTTPSGHASTFGERVGLAGAEDGVNHYSDGTTATRTVDSDGNRTDVLPDGTRITSTEAPDPSAFSAHRYQTRSVTRLPESGLTQTQTMLKTATTSSGLIDLVSEETCVAGRCSTTDYGAETGIRTTETPEGRVTTEFLDALDRLTELQAPGAPLVRTEYDGDRVTAIVIDPDGVEGNGDERETTMEYDPSTGLLAKVIDPLTHETVFGGYDGADRPQTITLPDLAQVQMTYDPEGNVASVTPPGKEPHGMTYGPRGRIESYTPPVGNGVEFFYDLDRRMDLIDFGLDAFGQTNQVDFEYYALTGQLKTITSPTGTIQLGFTNGHMTSLSAPSMSGTIVTSIDYDGFLPKSLSWIGPVAGEVNWTYNDRFLIETETIGALPTTTVQYQYDNDGLVTNAGDLEITRDPSSGRVVQKTIDRVRETFAYNEFAELARQTVELMQADGVTVKETLYDVVYDDNGVNGDRDALGRITKKTEWIVSEDAPTVEARPLDVRTYDYGYNQEGRPWLESVAVDGAVVSSYGYDDNGNRMSVESSWSHLGYDAKFDVSLSEADTEYDSADRLLTYGTKSYTWNNFGQLASMTDSDPNVDGDTSDAETTGYLYDLFGNLLRVDLPDGRAIEYDVDGAGRRVGRTELGADGNEISFRGWIYRDLLRPIAEVDRDGNVVARYVYSDGDGTRQNGVEQLKTRLGVNQDTSLPFSGRNVPEAIEFLNAAGAVVQRLALSTNQVGSVQLVTDAAIGEVVQRIEYDEFGRVVFDSAPGVQPFGFAGGMYEAATELVLFGARDYSPGLGRWIGPEPLRTSGKFANFYRYANSDPNNFVDANGEHPVLVGVLVVGAFIYWTIEKNRACAREVSLLQDEAIDCIKRLQDDESCGRSRPEGIAECHSKSRAAEAKSIDCAGNFANPFHF